MKGERAHTHGKIRKFQTRPQRRKKQKNKMQKATKRNKKRVKWQMKEMCFAKISRTNHLKTFDCSFMQQAERETEMPR